MNTLDSRALLGVCLIVSVSGCESEPAGSQYVVQDSAGIQFVDVDAAELPTTLTASPDPEWVIGDERDGDDLLLHGVADVVMLGPEEVAIAETDAQQVIRVDVASGDVQRWGGAGDGPEEFGGLARVFDLSDGRVGAYDRARRRFVVLGPDGVFEETMDLGPFTETSEPPVLELLDVGSGDRVFYLAERRGLPSGAVEGAHRGTGPVLLVDPGSEQVDTLTTISGNTTFAGSVGAGLVPFGATTLFAVDSRGLWIGDTAEREVSLWRASSQPRTVVRWSTDESLRLTEERVSELWGALEADAPEQEAAMVAQLREVVPTPENEPAFGSLIVGQNDVLWIGGAIPPEVEMMEMPPPAQDWLVLDLENEHVTTATTPDGFRPLRLYDDLAVGVHVDALGVETVRGYRMVSSESAP